MDVWTSDESHIESRTVQYTVQCIELLHCQTVYDHNIMCTLYYVQYTVRLTVYWDIILGHNIAISGPIGGPQSPESHE